MRTDEFAKKLMQEMPKEESSTGNIAHEEATLPQHRNRLLHIGMP